MSSRSNCARNMLEKERTEVIVDRDPDVSLKPMAGYMWAWRATLGVNLALAFLIVAKHYRARSGRQKRALQGLSQCCLESLFWER